MIANVLTIAGTDPSGGAGIQADLKAFSALGAYGCAVITALVAQNTRGVQAVELVQPSFVARQIDCLLADVRIDAVKIGMLATGEIVRVVADALRRHGLTRVVVDPVMVAKSGDRLLDTDAVAALREELLPLATVVTPNLPEAADLLVRAPAHRRDEMPEIAAALLALGPKAVLLKGGHLEESESPDLLLSPAGAVTLAAPRIATRNTHGTGCTLSAAIAALLPQRPDLETAVREAKTYLTGALEAADRLSVGGGHGPLHHFHRWWG
ncbi:bifunctional hydroxymethylpyrimidine kinase/phosphomethylpyrimidine kinase [Inquilinus sp.]|jgi:hydroxymethylpyrimidine/phosphomethylpyrimidine kinase|uniref:bifunctional hydroxymethylpyrimidine kinase/phosphomethylpyrimidine kinase n=1 Tax=Inquilinus sp. TaxID=1932117 RepID=UPI003784EF79